ncbi:unnamed protein product [Meloidogyne enterolobii]|uniref:Uncharacterized protein n=1 Tax=Meloidogyne enterolobii TaxID=390850 RepID=A0ACB0ZQ89_MELEN
MNPSQYPQWQQHLIPGYAPPIYSQNTGPPTYTPINLPTQFIPCTPSNYYQQSEHLQEKEKQSKLIEQLEKEKDSIQKEFEKLKLDYENLKKEKELEIQKRKESELRLSELEKSKLEVEERLTKRIRDLGSNNERLESELEDIENDYKGLEFQNDRLKKDNEKLVHDAIADDDEIAGLQRQLKESDDRNKDLNECLETLQLENNENKKKLEDSKKEYHKYKKRCSLCEEDLRKSQHILDKKELLINSLQKQLIESAAENLGLKKEVQDLQTKILIAERRAKNAEEDLNKRNIGGKIK